MNKVLIININCDIKVCNQTISFLKDILNKILSVGGGRGGGWGGGGGRGWVLIIHKKGATCFVCPGASFTPAVTAVSYHSRINTFLNFYFFCRNGIFFYRKH